ncbi:DUF1842 domain-containing protein [Chromobacterium sp. CV08]|uniref:DUF1842 domain-containing protein n=1 Tax=Chromobacterium sp. CV08 TaxID=3133274 RepID=UPI003DA9A7E3
MSGQTQDALFPVGYIITTGQSGAQKLQLNLLINSAAEKATGTAHITQATHPPLDVHADVWGQYTYLTVMPPSEGRILLTAQGNHGGPHANSAVNFKLHLVLERDWQRGIANYSYYDEHQKHWVSLENVPAELNRELQSRYRPQQGPGPAIPAGSHVVPLYGVPIHQALASGDLSQMKSLAALAQQQLDSHPQLRTELAALKAEIQKLEGR